MRQGNHFNQEMDTDENGMYIRIPEEIQYELEDCTSILWVSNNDGTYTLIPKH